MSDQPYKEQTLFSLCKKHDHPNIYLELCLYLNEHCVDNISYAAVEVEGCLEIQESTNSGGGTIPLETALRMVTEGLFEDEALAYGTWVSLDWQYRSYEAILADVPSKTTFGGYPSYQEDLASDHWQTVRKAAIKKAGVRCMLCNTDSEQLHVHHRTYERLGDEQPEDVIVLCATHHEQFPGKDGTK